MLIIFEGPDNSGKTTIAKALASQLGFSYFKHSHQSTYFTKIERSEIFIEANFFIDFLNQVNLKLIVDRHIPSEFVYSTVFQRPVYYQVIKKIDKCLANLGALLIYCEKTDYSEYFDSLISIDKIKNLIHSYRNYLQFTQMPFLVLDTTDQNLTVQLTQIFKFIGDSI